MLRNRVIQCVQDKNILIDTLKALLSDLQREKFVFHSIRKKKNNLAVQEQKSLDKIEEIRNRIDYNMKKHGELLK